MSCALSIAFVILAAAAQEQAPKKSVELVRTPERGLQPRAIVDASGTVHLVYFAGEPSAGELRYVKSGDGCESFSAPLRVNRGPASAMAVGNVRGAQIALGREGRLHVVWNGNGVDEQGSIDREGAPMLYTRIDDARKAFEPERDVIAKRHGLDGGGAVAADGAGNVYVAWHAPGDEGEGEEGRQVWLAVSHDDGKTFREETPASRPGSGVCPCCGIGAFALDGGGLAILYRTAHDREHRDTELLLSTKLGGAFKSRTLDPWKVPT